jgi:HEPN domain-containing protein
MKQPETALRPLVLTWLEKAAADLAAAEELCAANGRFRAIVAFHCQQAAEKYLKASLVRHQIEFPKTHDLVKLLDMAATANSEMAKSLRLAEVLTPFGVETRYPSDAPEIRESGEMEALDIARQVRDAVLLSLRRYLEAE